MIILTVDNLLSQVHLEKDFKIKTIAKSMQLLSLNVIAILKIEDTDNEDLIRDGISRCLTRTTAGLIFSNSGTWEFIK